MKTARGHRLWAIALWTASAVPGIIFPNIAQAGFFDFLFGPPQTQAVRPYDAYPNHFRRHADRNFHWRAHNFAARRKLVVADRRDHPVGPHAPTDLMDDASLHRGDAVMTQAGIRFLWAIPAVITSRRIFEKFLKSRNFRSENAAHLPRLTHPDRSRVDKQLVNTASSRDGLQPKIILPLDKPSQTPTDGRSATSGRNRRHSQQPQPQPSVRPDVIPESCRLLKFDHATKR